MKANNFFHGILFLVVTNFSHAALIDNGDFTTDTDTGLDWLDMSFNTRVTYDEMVATDLNGYGSRGYRYASVAEVITLWTNAGIPEVPGYDSAVTSAANIPALTALEALVGLTDSNYVAGYVSDIDPGVGSTDVYRFVPWFRASSGQVVTEWSQPSNRWAGNVISSWLVRQTEGRVPSPGTLALVLLGLISLVRLNPKEQGV